MEHLQTVFQVVLTALTGGIFWMLKCIIKRIDNLMEEEHKCREGLPYKFASKESVIDLWNKADELGADLRYIQGKMNGGRQ